MKQYNLVLILLVYSLLAGCQQAVQIDGLPFRQSAQQGWGIINEFQQENTLKVHQQ